MEKDNKSQVGEAVQKEFFAKIVKNDLDGFKLLIDQYKGINLNFLDADGMNLLQHAACKGNLTMVQTLLDMGADVDYHQHGANYTPLHFAALSGSTEVCRLLLDAGVNPTILNSVSRTASQMAQFVGNHTCVETINNYLPRNVLEYYTIPQGLQTEPLLPPSILESFHKFVISTNLHPVRIVLNLQTLHLLKYLPGLSNTFKLMCEKEMKKTYDVNEVMAFKYHYLGWIISELMRCEEQCKAQRKEKPNNTEGDVNKSDFVEMFIKRVLKENKLGQLDYVEFTIRDCTREFQFRECTIFRQIVASLAAKDAPPALVILKNAINGQRGFSDDISNCSSCGNEKPDKKCSKCRAVQYCDRECQRLHWFMHKKSCARPTTGAINVSTSNKEPIDTNELRDEIARMTAS